MCILQYLWIDPICCRITQGAKASTALATATAGNTNSREGTVLLTSSWSYLFCNIINKVCNIKSSLYRQGGQLYREFPFSKDSLVDVADAFVRQQTLNASVNTTLIRPSQLKVLFVAPRLFVKWHSAKRHSSYYHPFQLITWCHFYDKKLFRLVLHFYCW